MAIRVKRVIGISFLLLLVGGIVIAGIFCAGIFPIISGYSAKMTCSEVFLCQRTPQSVKEEDLAFFPLKFSSCDVNYKDSTVTASVFGFCKRTAIYRAGFGATLISESTADSLRSQARRTPVAPVPDTDSVLWPMGDKLVSAADLGLDSAKLQTAMTDFFAEPDPEHRKLTRAVLVVYHGQVIAERYAPGYSKDSRFLGWSMAKSVTGALTGILAKNSIIDIGSPVPVSEWKSGNDPRMAITWKDLLQQMSGLRFVEDYSKSSDATIMLYKKANMAGFALDHPLDTLPGTKFIYSSGNSNIISLAIRRTVGDSQYHAFPYRELFYKLGMYHTEWEPDESGTYVGSSYLFASARDWARFGLLYLDHGRWNNQQLLPENWTDLTVTPVDAKNFDHYGFQFWLNTGKKKGKDGRFFPDVPDDMFFADGFQGQNIFIIPSRDLLVVRLGMTATGDYHADHSLGLLLEAIK